MDTNKILYLPNETFFAINGDVLTEYKFKKAIYCKGKLTLEATDSTGESFECYDDDVLQLYNSPEEFKARKNKRKYAFNPYLTITGRIKTNAKEGLKEVYYNDDGPNVRSIDDITIIWTYENGCIRENLDTEYYPTLEEYYKHNDYKQLNLDGTTIIRPCIKNKISLTKAQEKAVNAVAEAIKKAKDLNVEFILDADYTALYAFNKENVKKIEAFNRYDTDEEDVAGCIDIDTNFGKEVMRGIGQYYNCDYSIFIKE